MSVLHQPPFALSLSKRRQSTAMGFDKLSPNGFFR